MSKYNSSKQLMGFVSYSRKDLELYPIPKIVLELEKFPEIRKLVYYEGAEYSNIINYMNKNIENCDFFLYFCSENAKKSRYIQTEWQAAFQKEKKIIPVFYDKNDIPALLSPNLGVQYELEHFDTNINEIYNTILKAFGIKAIESYHIEDIETDIDDIKHFRGIQLLEIEVIFLKEIEEITLRQFKPVSDFMVDNTSKMQFTIKDNRIYEIGMYNCDLSELPETLGNLKFLKTLELDNNRLRFLPNSITNLISLEKLYLGDNQIKIIPQSILNLSNLELLNLGNNKILNLPDSIANLISLRELNLYNNELESLPESIGSLNNLKYLNISWNNLQSLPDSIGELNTLKILNLESNILSNIPNSMLSLTLLENLNLKNNQLISLPKNFGELKSLKEIHLRNNRLKSIPNSFNDLESLRILDVDNNPIVKSNPKILNILKNKGIEIYPDIVPNLPKKDYVEIRNRPKLKKRAAQPSLLKHKNKVIDTSKEKLSKIEYIESIIEDLCGKGNSVKSKKVLIQKVMESIHTNNVRITTAFVLERIKTLQSNNMLKYQRGVGWKFT